MEKYTCTTGDKMNLLFVVLTLQGFNQVGVQPYCTVNEQEKIIVCNYESKNSCEGYRATEEYCIVNPDRSN